MGEALIRKRRRIVLVRRMIEMEGPEDRIDRTLRMSIKGPEWQKKGEFMMRETERTFFYRMEEVKGGEGDERKE